ncbi:caspase family protein [Leptolyngbya ohadii]|uniref:caspase family protein n=1 Tax=Leptolyngbya ohadii TaxID=1962290 RepID=UPI000B59DCC8|nr:caspase family protein [Leptolyngbya ohadii]
MRVNRREFLQQLGGVLAALGIGEAGWMALTDRSQQVLAAPTRRKLALLIGVNQYPEAICDFVPPKGSALNGCLTDVELQRELLLHRFGFQPEDILTLTDQQATRSAIESAFQSHLLDQAKSGDVVLFHFSGLGSRVSLGSDPTEQQIEQQSLVPIDGLLPTADNPVVNDLMLDTLLLLLRSLPTQQVITVLDTGFTHLGRINQGSLRIRSRPSAPSGQLLKAEQNLQTQLFERLRLSPNPSLNHLRSSNLPGVMLTSSGFEQVSTEAQWGGFYAGLLTYAVTQQLWCSTPTTTLDFCLRRAIGTVKQAAGKGQQPNVSSPKQLNLTSMLGSGDAIGNTIGNITGNTAGNTAGNAVGADGFIRSIDDEGKIFLWLGGLPPIVVENAGSSLFAVVTDDAETQPAALLQVRSREGLLARVKRQSSDSSAVISIGQPVQEVLRYLPRNPSLIIGLDASLARVERVDATSAFATIPQVSAVIAGEQSADLLFGKTQAESATLTASLAPNLAASQTASDSVPPLTPDPIANKRGYGLFSLDRSAIYSTLNQDDEAVKTAVHRLTPQLRALLANKLLRLLENRGSSRLGIRATLLTTAPQERPGERTVERIVAQQETTRAPWTAPQPNPRLMPTPSLQVAIGSRIQYQMLNYSDRPLYFMAIGLDAEGLPVVYPPALVKDSPSALQEAGMIAPGTTRTLLQSDSETLVQAPGGIVETHLLFSRSPFVQAVDFLYSKLRISATQRITNLANSLDLVQAVLQDLQQLNSPADAYALDVNHWATFSFVYEVVSA